MSGHVTELKAWWDEEVAKYVDDHYTGGLTVDHRPMTNVEMQADIHAGIAEKERRIAEHGCCGEGRDSAGRCFGYGLCPLYVQALEMVKNDGGEHDDF